MGLLRTRGNLYLLVVGSISFTLAVFFYGHPNVFPRTLHSEQDGPRREKTARFTEQLVSSKPFNKQNESCPSSVKSHVESDAIFRNVFNFSVPVFLWEKHLNKATWERLQEHKLPYGWKQLPNKDINSTLKLLNEPENAWLFDARAKTGCIRCAVVGNGGILNGSRQGKEIDAHEFVIRLNGAIIKGFEKDVGTKTSFYGFTTNTLKNSLIAYWKWGYRQVPQAEDLRYIFIPSEHRDYIMLRSAILGVRVPYGQDEGNEPWKYFGFNTAANKFKLLHPDFIHYIEDRFLKSEMLNSEYRELYMPSTGALMLMIALHQCDQVSAYGFITDNYKKFSDHYYERVKQPLMFYANHDMLMEAKLWKALNSAGIMKLYQR